MEVISDIIDRARKIVMTPEQREAQRQSFAYGNVKLHNPRITRELIAKVARELK